MINFGNIDLNSRSLMSFNSMQWLVDIGLLFEFQSSFYYFQNIQSNFDFALSSLWGIFQKVIFFEHYYKYLSGAKKEKPQLYC